MGQHRENKSFEQTLGVYCKRIDEQEKEVQGKRDCRVSTQCCLFIHVEEKNSVQATAPFKHTLFYHLNIMNIKYIYTVKTNQIIHVWWQPLFKKKSDLPKIIRK